MRSRPMFTMLTLFCATGVLTACGVLSRGGQASQADIQATIDTQVQATIAAQQAQATPLQPTAMPDPTSEAPTQPPPELATTPPFEPGAQSPTADATVLLEATTQTDGTRENDSTVAAVPTSAPVVFEPPSGEEEQATINIQLVFDASGSMAEDIGDETKIQAARRAIEQVIAQLPDDASNLNVGFRVFGHEGDNTESGRAVSCQSTELLVPMSGIDKPLLQQQATAWEPIGWTPISLALQRAGEDLQSGENVRNIIIMVTDGEETCEGDPCAVAEALANSGADVRIDVVGFGLTPDVADTLRCISENTGGSYIDAQDGDGLVQVLTALVEGAATRGTLYIQAVGPGGEPVTIAWLDHLHDEQGQEPLNTAGSPVLARKRDGSLEPPAGPFTDDGETTYELDPGTYTFRLAYDSNEVSNSFEIPDDYLTYTAVIAENSVTFAPVGIGSVTLVPAGVVDDYRCYLELEMQIEGEWTKIEGYASEPPCDTRFAMNFNQQYLLLPGVYRVTDSSQARPGDDGAVVTEFAIEPGLGLELQIEQRSS